MEVKLTSAQWESLKRLVRQGEMGQAALGVPVEVVNGDEKIEITSDEVTIVLAD